jgi:TctA family transporter
MDGAVPLGLISSLMGGFWVLIMLLPLVAMVMSLAFFAGWIWMLLDVVQRDENTFKSKDEKLLWVLIVVLGGWIGVLPYYIMEYRRYRGLDAKKK